MYQRQHAKKWTTPKFLKMLLTVSPPQAAIPAVTATIATAVTATVIAAPAATATVTAAPAAARAVRELLVRAA